ncbi:E3 ubiquitin-protein ligase RING1-like [Lolium rigidum]|uniref:E3 ubiquitin-protein ligase RING1-like n=1 Tax=Lolium rigidum TaxID=89674 RepID=UPI001F5DE955|nr:E3 ubiquitin-protein ligase RING1-like [Lolium rigidum]
MPPDLLKQPCPGSYDADDYECPSPPPPPSSNGSRHLVTPLVVTAFVVLFLFLASLSIYCFIRRRRLRRQQQQSLLAGVQPDGTQPAAAAATDVEAGAPEDEAVQHHAWHIRTVGLDEAAIESIALTRYRPGTVLGAADCPVCLGEFLDGELLRLLPRCAHAFHAPCIATWLRAHVNCPLCRAHVVLDDDPAAGAADSNASPAHAEQASSGTETLDHEQPGQRQDEQDELRVQIDQCDQLSSPEPQRRRARDFRRVVSMDPSVVSARQQSGKDIPGNGGGAACCELPSGSGHLCQMKRSLSGGGRWSLGSRHRRARSSLLPS